MGADKNSSRWRSKLQQDERGFQHTSPIHYPSWPSPRSHWSATGPRSQHTQPTDPRTQRNTKPRVYRPTPVRLVSTTGQTGPCWCNRATFIEWLYTGQTGETHIQTDRSLKAPKAPNRPTDHQTDPNSKQQHHGTTTNTPRRSPEQKPTRARTDQTGQEHRSDRCSLGSSG
jgi:hypothetical protein